MLTVLDYISRETMEDETKSATDVLDKCLLHQLPIHCVHLCLMSGFDKGKIVKDNDLQQVSKYNNAELSKSLLCVFRHNAFSSVIVSFEPRYTETKD